MNNKEFVRGVYDEIHAPEELFGKVMNMNKKESKKNNIMRFATGAVATLALAFVASNGICYAATGETWVEKAYIYINGEKQEIEMEMHQDGDVTYGSVEFEVDENDTNEIVYSETLPEEELPEGQLEETASLEEKDGKIYLNLYNSVIDITEDFADGEATGSTVVDGVEYEYIVTGNISSYDLLISSGE